MNNLDQLVRFTRFAKCIDTHPRTVHRWQKRETDSFPESMFIGRLEFLHEQAAVEWLERNLKPTSGRPEPKELTEGREEGIRWQKQRKAARLAKEATDGKSA